MSFAGNKSNVAACFGFFLASADFDKKNFFEKFFQEHHHTREPCTRTAVVVACWLQSTSAQDGVPSY